MKVIRTLKLRIKDKHQSVLVAMARDVNQVWNYLNELSNRAIVERRQYLSGYDLQKYTKGFSKCDGVTIGSTTVQAICEEYANRRKQFKKTKLKWRVSNPKSSKRSLGWIPFKKGALIYRNGQVKLGKLTLSLWDSYGLSKYDFRAGSINQDARGRWHLNIVVEVEAVPSKGTASVGIDLGLERAAVCSNGEFLLSRNYRKYEKLIGIAQRARKPKRVQSLHAKAFNKRKDDKHKITTHWVKNNGLIVVGNVSVNWLMNRSAKSTLDAGLAGLKTMLEYKCQGAGVVFEIVNEQLTTQTCSCCGAVPPSSPKGSAGLEIREWTCDECGSIHDRDINAAKNILARGHSRLAVGIPAL